MNKRKKQKLIAMMMALVMVFTVTLPVQAGQVQLILFSNKKPHNLAVFLPQCFDNKILCALGHTAILLSSPCDKNPRNLV